MPEIRTTEIEYMRYVCIIIASIVSIKAECQLTVFPRL